jgi:hypothetical protein
LLSCESKPLPLKRHTHSFHHDETQKHLRASQKDRHTVSSPNKEATAQYGSQARAESINGHTLVVAGSSDYLSSHPRSLCGLGRSYAYRGQLGKAMPFFFFSHNHKSDPANIPNSPFPGHLIWSFKFCSEILGKHICPLGLSGVKLYHWGCRSF